MFNRPTEQDCGGFDIVIGNPPYIKELDNAKTFIPINNSPFGKKYHAGKMDYWFYFLHKSIEIIKKNGIASFITSRYWLKSAGAKKLIKHISGEMSFLQIVDIGRLKVFDNVVGNHMIAIYQKNVYKNCLYKSITNNVERIIKNEFEESRIITKENLISSDYQINIEKTIHYNTKSVLGDICFIGQGIVEASDKISQKMYGKNPSRNHYIGEGIFVLSKTELENLHLNSYEMQSIELYAGDAAIQKYSIDYKKSKYLIYSDDKLKNKIKSNKQYINLKNHLDNLREYITSSNKPYGLHRPRIYDNFIQPKLIGASMFAKPCFSFDDKKLFVGMSFNIITSKGHTDLKFVLALLNSKFGEYWYYTNGKHRGTGVDIGVNKLRTFPIPPATQEQKKPIITLVDKILAAKKADAAADTRELEK